MAASLAQYSLVGYLRTTLAVSFSMFTGKFFLSKFNSNSLQKGDTICQKIEGKPWNKERSLRMGVAGLISGPIGFTWMITLERVQI